MVEYTKFPTSKVEKRELVSWNIMADQAMYISSLLKRATNAYLNGYVKSWFWILTAIRELINCNLKQDERQEFDKLEKEVDIGLIKKGKKTVFVMSVRKYQRKLLDMVKELGYFPSKEDRTKLGF